MKRFEAQVRDYLKRNELIVRTGPITIRDWTAHILAAECIKLRANEQLYFPRALMSQLYGVPVFTTPRLGIVVQFLETEYEYYSHGILSEVDLDTMYLMEGLRPGYFIKYPDGEWKRTHFKSERFTHDTDVGNFSDSNKNSGDFETTFTFTDLDKYVAFIRGALVAMSVIKTLSEKFPDESRP